MRITCFIVGFLSVILFSCTERTICPAYQSAFMHDERSLTAHFSYFQEDSTPKLRDVNKNRFLLVDPVAYNKRKREMQTVVMKDIYPVVDYSAMVDERFELLAERDGLDSAALALLAKDSIHPGLVGPFNTDQELYMYYLRDVLILPDARESMVEDAEKKALEKKREKKKKSEEEEAEKKKKKKGPFSIFNKNKEKKNKEKKNKEKKNKDKKEKEESDADNTPPPVERVSDDVKEDPGKDDDF